MKSVPCLRGMLKSRWHYIMICHVLTCRCSKHTQYDSWHGRIGHLNHRQINFITEENLGC